MCLYIKFCTFKIVLYTGTQILNFIFSALANFFLLYMCVLCVYVYMCVCVCVCTCVYCININISHYYRPNYTVLKSTDENWRFGSCSEVCDAPAFGMCLRLSNCMPVYAGEGRGVEWWAGEERELG